MAERDFGDGLADLARAESTADVEARYDDWAGRYDEDLAQWGYEVPSRLAADVLASESGPPWVAPLLDAGCGTGLFGAVLRQKADDAGIAQPSLTGIDLSEESLAIARERGSYSKLLQGDLLVRLPWPDATFQAVVCGGVMTYVASPEPVLREFLRVVMPGQRVLFTQRTDLWVERECDDVIARLVESGACAAAVGAPQPYLPGAAEYGDSIRVLHTELVRTSGR